MVRVNEGADSRQPAGDARLLGKLRYEELIRSGSRIRTRAATRDELLAWLDHLLAAAGNISLMTKELRHTFVDHAAGDQRTFIAMAAAQRDISVLDEKLQLQVFAPPQTQQPRLTVVVGR